MDKKLPKIIVSALIEKEEKFLLVKEILESGKQYWIIPGGSVEYGENLEEALKREIKEETNLDIEILEFIDFKEIIQLQFNYHTIIFFFRVKPVNYDLILEDDKILDGRFFSKEEIKELKLVDSNRWLLEKLKIL